MRWCALYQQHQILGVIYYCRHGCLLSQKVNETNDLVRSKKNDRTWILQMPRTMVTPKTCEPAETSEPSGNK